MPLRSRSRSCEFDFFALGPLGTIVEGGTSLPGTREFFTDYRPGPGHCYHSVAAISSSSATSNDGQYSYHWNNLPVFPSFLGGSNGKRISSAISSLNWDKLVTSNKAGLIQILADVDQTVLIFTSRWWKELSYGSVTWGLLPFVSDLVSTARVVSNLFANLASVSYEDGVTISLTPTEPSYTGSVPGNIFVLGGSAKIHKSGRADLSANSGLDIALDRLGFHPDLATAWDLLPLSFVVDYILPVGDYLENFRQGGWIKSVGFSGWTSVKITVDLAFATGGSSSYSKAVNPIGLARSYQRTQDVSVLTYQPEIADSQLQFELPSLRELINTMYLMAQRS